MYGNQKLKRRKKRMTTTTKVSQWAIVLLPSFPADFGPPRVAITQTPLSVHVLLSFTHSLLMTVAKYNQWSGSWCICSCVWLCLYFRGHLPREREEDWNGCPLLFLFLSLSLLLFSFSCSSLPPLVCLLPQTNCLSMKQASIEPSIGASILVSMLACVEFSLCVSLLLLLLK